MPVNTPHPKYVEYSKKWERARDLIAGDDAVRKKTTEYLPPLEAMEYRDDNSKRTKVDNVRYERFLQRTTLFAATQRTFGVYRGMIFRKPPVITLPPGLEAFSSNITQSGRDLVTEIRRSVSELLKVGRYGVMVDHPPRPAELEGRSVSTNDMERLQLRPYIATYTAENIINWDTRKFGNVTKPSLYVLREEKFERRPDDPFVYKPSVCYRVLELDSAPWGASGEERLIYSQQTYVQDVKTGNWNPDPESFRIPKRDGQPLDHIPFHLFNLTDDDDLDPDEPPLDSIVVENIAHYMITAQHRTALMYSAGPMTVIFGVPFKCDEAGNVIGEPYDTGPGIVWQFEQPKSEADVKMHEPSGSGIPEHRFELERISHQMAVQGARMLENDKAAAESAETTGMKRQGEFSTLADYARYDAKKWVDVLTEMQEWAVQSGDITIQLNTDYIPVRMSPQEMQALFAGWQAGAMSWETLYANLQRGEIADADRTAEEEQELIEDEGIKATESLPMPPIVEDPDAEDDDDEQAAAA